MNPWEFPESTRFERSRLLTFLSNFAIGGTERQVVNLACRMDLSKFAPSFGCFRRGGKFLKEIEALNIPISEYPIHSLYSHHTIAQQFRFARMLRANRIQILHSYGFYTTAFALPAAKLAGTPIVIASIRDTGAHLTTSQQLAQKIVCRFADSVLVNADAVREWLIADGYRSDKIRVIHNGIDTSRFQNTNRHADIRQQLGVPPDAPLIAMFGRLNRVKGAEYFVDAAGVIASQFRDAHFLIVGDAYPEDRDYKEELTAQARRLGLGDRLIFAGFRLDIPELLSDISISVLPSLSEGLSNVLLEAMAAGVPVIATMVGGNPEIVEDGVTGLLVPARDSGALARALCLLLENPEMACRFGQAGRQRISTEFHLDHMVRRTEQHYMELLERTAPKEARRAGEVRA